MVGFEPTPESVPLTPHEQKSEAGRIRLRLFQKGKPFRCITIKGKDKPF